MLKNTASADLILPTSPIRLEDGTQAAEVAMSPYLMSAVSEMKVTNDTDSLSTKLTFIEFSPHPDKTRRNDRA
jgi:hypothetical protein